jgi:hypothetical protein
VKVLCCNQNAVASEKGHPDSLLDVLYGLSAIKGETGPSLKFLLGESLKERRIRHSEPLLEFFRVSHG